MITTRKICSDYRKSNSNGEIKFTEFDLRLIIDNDGHNFHIIIDECKLTANNCKNSDKYFFDTLRYIIKSTFETNNRI